MLSCQPFQRQPPWAAPTERTRHNRILASVKERSIYLSIVVPLYNEEESIGPLHDAITSAMHGYPAEYELVFVNDGSRDRTAELAIALTERDPRLRFIDLRKNSGQTPAMAAGIDNARGEVIVTMDGDLQNDPTDIPMLVDTLNQGFDIVVGWRHKRQDTLITRKIPSKIANWLIGKVTGVPIKDNGCSLKAYRAKVIKSMPFYSEMHRFIPALLSISGARVEQVKVKHHARQFGESKYGLSRIYKVLFDLLMMKTVLSVATHPVRWFVKLSALPWALALLYMVVALKEISVNSDASMVYASITVILFCLGAFLVSLGFICELIYAKGDLKIAELVPLTARVRNPRSVAPDRVPSSITT